MSYIGKIMPVDGYKVLFSGTLHVDYTKSLTHLYQPLIGIKAVALYYTLIHELDLQLLTTKQTHHTLMGALNMPLDEIFEARLKLEGIGLLKTYKITNDTEVIYTYELITPFTPTEFFNDLMLTELLYRHVGQTKYQLLEKHYIYEQFSSEGEQLTVSFKEVFQTFEPEKDVFKNLVKDNIKSHIPIDKVDFTWIEQALKKQMVPVEKVLTSDNKEKITQIMHLYELELYEVERSIIWALTDENELNIDEFQNACHDMFKVKHNDVKIELTLKEEIVEEVEVPSIKKSYSKEEALIQKLQVVSPKQLLEDLSSGNNASESDMKLIRDIMTKQGLPTSVMNVLIHYVLLQSNMQLSKAYLEKIASHWSRANLKNAKEAMAFAKEQSVDKKQGNRYKKETKEVIPEWFKDRDKEKEETKKEDHTQIDEIKRAELLAQFQKTLE